MATWYRGSDTSTSSIGNWGYSGSTDNWTSTAATYNDRRNWAQAQTVKRIYVKCPEHWDADIDRAFCDLVNFKTNTGWKANAIIRGDIEIQDPNIEVRPMCDFVPLLKMDASPSDRERITAFFEQFPLEAP